MNKNQFVAEFAKRHNMTYAGGHSICNDVLTLLSECVNREDKVQLGDLGVFKKVSVQGSAKKVVFEPSALIASRHMPAPQCAASSESIINQTLSRRIDELGASEVISRIMAPRMGESVRVTKKAASYSDQVRVCAHCGKPFTPHHQSQKYCSDECVSSIRKIKQSAYARRYRSAKVAQSSGKVGMISAPGATIHL